MSDSNFYLERDADTGLLIGAVYVNRLVQLQRLRRLRLRLLAEAKPQ